MNSHSENAVPRPEKRRRSGREVFVRRRTAGLRRRHQRKRQRTLQRNLAALAAELVALREALTAVEKVDGQATRLAARIEALANRSDTGQNGGTS